MSQVGVVEISRSLSFALPDIVQSQKKRPRKNRGRSLVFVNESGCYWIVTLIAGAAGVAAGVVVIAMVVAPVTVMLMRAAR